MPDRVRLGHLDGLLAGRTAAEELDERAVEGEYGRPVVDVVLVVLAGYARIVVFAFENKNSSSSFMLRLYFSY